MAVPRLILASRSPARAALLSNAGLAFDAIPAQIPEEEFMRQMLESGIAPEQIALKLAEEKAAVISREHKHNTVIGSDQVLVLGDKVFAKAEDKKQALEKLKQLRGKTHTLISAVCIARDGEILWDAYEKAYLTMHDFDDAFLEDYMASAGKDLTECVGAYALEKSGSWLFSKIEGDYFTILGMPLLPLLGFLKELGFRP